MAYPKKLYNDEGDCVLAKQEVHEADLRRKGYHDAPEEVAPPPTDCPNCMVLAAKVADLEKQLAPKLLEELKAGELLAYAKEKGLNIGDLKAQHGAEKILAAIKAAEAAKPPEGQA